MRALTTFLMIFSLTFGDLALAQSVNFRTDPDVTVELEESSIPLRFYFYGGIAIAVSVVLACAVLNFSLLRRLFLRPSGGPLSPRPIPRGSSLHMIEIHQ